MKVFGVTILSLFILASTLLGATRTSVQSGNWNDRNTWSPRGTPGTEDKIIIATGTTVTITTNESCSDLKIMTGGTLQGDGSPHLLAVGKDGGEDFLNDGVFDANGITMKLQKNTQWSGSGVWNLGNVELNGKNLTFTAGVAITINLSGAGDPFSGYGTFVANDLVTFNYTGTSPQVLTASSGGVYGNILINNAAGVTLSQALTAGNTLGNIEVQSGTLNNGGFGITLNSGMSFGVADGATFVTTASTFDVTGTINLAASSTVDYAGTNQTVATLTYGNLTVCGSGTTTVSGDVTVDGTLTICNGSTLDMGNYVLTLNGTLVNNGTLVSSVPAVVNAKIFLEGPYSGGSMGTGLIGAGNLPTGQPYNTAPWNYPGGENVTSMPSTIVDWVLVELRSNETTPVATRAALVKDEGTIVDTDGSSAVSFPGVAPGNYYIVLRHRNHLAVMSAGVVALGSSSALYDFTDWTGGEKAYGGVAGMKEVSTGVYAMYAGDADGDNVVTVLDYNPVGVNIFEATYLGADLDMDGVVTVLEYNPIAINMFSGSQVP